MNFFLFILYQALKLLVKLVFKIYFSQTSILNKEYLSFSNPAILVSNHPNTLFDPLNAACYVKKVVYFLANASLYQTKIGNWFFSTFYCIPIQRSQDDGDNTKIDNEASFARCNEFLSGGGCLYIAPEGTSVVERKLRPLKSGTARIALSAENQNDFKLGLTILPIGLNYSSPTKFRSKVLLNVGTPIQVAKYASLYKTHAFEAAKTLTLDLENQMKELLLHSENELLDQLLLKIEEMMHNDQPLSHPKEFIRAKEVLNSLYEWKKTDPKKFNDLQLHLNNYFNEIHQLRVSDKSAVQFEAKPGFFRQWAKSLNLSIGFPLFLYGWINNFVPNYIPAFVANQLKLYIGYKSTVKAICGLLTYPLFYGTQIVMVQYFTGNAWVSLAYAVSLAPSGLFAWKYAFRLKEYYFQFRLRRLFFTQSEKVNKLIALRKKLKLLLSETKPVNAPLHQDD